MTDGKRLLILEDQPVVLTVVKIPGGGNPEDWEIFVVRTTSVAKHLVLSADVAQFDAMSLDFNLEGETAEAFVHLLAKRPQRRKYFDKPIRMHSNDRAAAYQMAELLRSAGYQNAFVDGLY